jgi:hypothetical protein
VDDHPAGPLSRRLQRFSLLASSARDGCGSRDTLQNAPMIITDTPNAPLGTNLRDRSMQHEHGETDRVSHIINKKMWDYREV